MAYNPSVWANGQQGGTPITAAKLNKIEAGVRDAHSELEGRLSEEELSATYASRDGIVRARNGEVSVWGHSYAFGIGATDVGRRWGSLVADDLRLRERNEAISGTAVASEGSGASWGAVLQKVTRSSRGAVSGSGVAASSQRGFASPGGVHLLQYGINDIQDLGTSSAALAPVKEALRTIISRLRAGAIFEDTSSTFTFTGTWPTPADTTKNSGPGYHYATTSTPSYSITTPADFPGGTIAIGLHSPSGVGNGAVHNVVVNGGAPTAYSRFSTRSGSSTHHVIRLPNLPAGANTIAVTLSGVVNYTAVDYWQWEASVDLPLIVLLKQPLPVDYSAYGVSPVVNDTGVSNLNAIIDEVAAEFDSRVITVDLSVMDHDATMFAADKLHPSDKGHRKIAQLTVESIADARFTVEAAQGTAPRIEYGAAAPTGTRTFYSVGDEVRNSSPAEAGTAGSKYITYGWICTVEGRPGTWLPLRYLTGN